MILDPGYNLTLRPMKYPQFYDYYRTALKNTWMVDEIDFTGDIADLRKVTPAEAHMIKRLVAFFATGDSIVANNIVLHLYRGLNSPEARLYLSRQLFEEAVHVQFYLTLLDSYIPSMTEREEAFNAVSTIPSIAAKAELCNRFSFGAVGHSATLSDREGRRAFVHNLIHYAACVEGLFFFSAFAYVYYLRSRGLFNGLAAGTNWVFRDESMHMAFAFDALALIKSEEPSLFDASMESAVRAMVTEAVEAECLFAKDLLAGGVSGLSERDMRTFIQFTANQRLRDIGYDAPELRNPFSFMELQNVQELTNFFERRVSAYQVGVTGGVSFDEAF